MPKAKTKRARAKRAAEARRRARVRAAPRPSRAPTVTTYIDWPLILKAAAMFSLIGAGTIHAVWMGIHLEEWATAGVFFLALAMVQTILAFALFAFPTERVYLAVIVINLGTALVWVVSRTVGMPIGPEPGIAESVGAPDAVATFFEVLGAVALVPLLLERPEPRAGSRRRIQRRLSPSVYALIGGLGVYMLMLTGIAVVPAASRHEAREPGGGHAEGSRHEPSEQAREPRSERRGQAPRSFEMTADQLAFSTLRFELAASRKVEVRFSNFDSARHNLAIYRTGQFERPVFDGEVIDGDSTTTYRFEAPPRGRYPFRCDVHPFMNGTVEFR